MSLSAQFDQRIDMMPVMRYPHISKLDFDLLVHLAVLLEERHITRAANRCFLSQSAMSRQLERLREALGDELLLRNGRSHERTARGEQLLRELEPLLPRTEGILQERSFDPANSQDRFQVTMTIALARCNVVIGFAAIHGSGGTDQLMQLHGW